MYKIRISTYEEGQGLKELSVNLDWQKDIQEIESDRSKYMRDILKEREQHWKI